MIARWSDAARRAFFASRPEEIGLVPGAEDVLALLRERGVVLHLVTFGVPEAQRRKIEVLGTGCAKCAKLAENAQQAITELGIEAEVVKIEDLMEIAGRGILMTPGLAIDGAVKSSGRLLSADEIKALLREEG